MSGNRRRWKDWVENQQTVELLKQAAIQLKRTWERDSHDPERYPVDTDYLFCQIRGILQGKSERESPKILFRVKPRRFSDLAPETAIKGVYENQNTGRYEEALKKAWQGPEREAWAAFQKILRAVERAYLASYYGVELLPAPRVHFLHRNLLEIADLARLNDLTYEGLAEFLDDLCPCGRKHTKEAVRKLRKRLLGTTPM
jgi:hypothetical protein